MDNTRLLLALAATVALLALPTTGVAGPILTGGSEAATASNDKYGRDQTYGYDFVSTTNQQLTALGLWDQGADGVGPHPVGLWATATQTLLASVTLDSSDPLDLTLTVEGGNWRYETLAVPVGLTAGTTYTLGWWTGGNFSTLSSLYLTHATMAVAPTVTIADQVRTVNSGGLAFPTLVSGAGNHFVGMVNAQVVPEPGSATLLAIPGLALLLRRRRK